MKKATAPWWIALLACVALYSPLGLAQEYPEYEDELFTPAELDSILAPIALYPDSVLSHVLIASTYPLEVIQAARWTRENPGLDGELAVAAVEDFDWDPSVKALTAFPELLARMDEDIEWTQQIGDAFLIQEASVVAAIQGLRDRAYAQGHLRTNDHVRVVREERVIYIEPARTRYVHVPYYDPLVVYGRWWWDAYPPYRWRHPRYHAGISFYWGSGFRIAPTFYFSSFHWSRKRVVVVHHHHYPRQHFRSGREVARYHRAAHWRHDPHHRRGVQYRHRVQDTRLVEQRAGQTRRADPRQRSVVDQRRWASSRRNELDLRAAPQGRSQRQGRAVASRSRSAQTDTRSRRAVAESNAANTRTLRQATRQRQKGSVARTTQRSRSASTGAGDSTERVVSRRAETRLDRSNPTTRSITRSSSRSSRQSQPTGRARVSSPIDSAGISVPRSLDAGSAVQRSTRSRSISRMDSPGRAAPPQSRQRSSASRPQSRRAPQPRREAAPVRSSRQAVPRASRNNRARVQSRSRSARGDRRRQD